MRTQVEAQTNKETQTKNPQRTCEIKRGKFILPHHRKEIQILKRFKRNEFTDLQREISKLLYRSAAVIAEYSCALKNLLKTSHL